MIFICRYYGIVHKIQVYMMASYEEIEGAFGGLDLDDAVAG